MARDGTTDGSIRCDTIERLPIGWDISRCLLDCAPPCRPNYRSPARVSLEFVIVQGVESAAEIIEPVFVRSFVRSPVSLSFSQMNEWKARNFDLNEKFRRCFKSERNFILIEGILIEHLSFYVTNPTFHSDYHESSCYEWNKGVTE